LLWTDAAFRRVWCDPPIAHATAPSDLSKIGNQQRCERGESDERSETQTRPIGHDGETVVDDSQHAACVDAFLKRPAKDLSPEVLLQLFEAVLSALWARTTTTLGEITLTAIAERVLYNASEKFPLFSSLHVEPTGGIQFRELHKRIGSVHKPELMEGIRFVLVEFLTVLGNLTAEILTPELHSELNNVATTRGGPRRERAQHNATKSQDTKGEDKKS